MDFSDREQMLKAHIKLWKGIKKELKKIEESPQLPSYFQSDDFVNDNPAYVLKEIVIKQMAEEGYLNFNKVIELTYDNYCFCCVYDTKKRDTCENCLIKEWREDGGCGDHEYGSFDHCIRKFVETNKRKHLISSINYAQKIADLGEKELKNMNK